MFDKYYSAIMRQFGCKGTNFFPNPQTFMLKNLDFARKCCIFAPAFFELMTVLWTEYSRIQYF